MANGAVIESRVGRPGGGRNRAMSSPTTVPEAATAAAAAAVERPLELSPSLPPPPLQLHRKRQGHRQRTDLEAPLAPLFAPRWAFEVGGAQLRRVLGHICGPNGDGRQPPSTSAAYDDGHGEEDEALVAGCVEDRSRQQASGLVAATGRVDLLRVPEAHRRHISRVFWVSCFLVGW